MLTNPASAARHPLDPTRLAARRSGGGPYRVAVAYPLNLISTMKTLLSHFGQSARLLSKNAMCSALSIGVLLVAVPVWGQTRVETLAWDYEADTVSNVGTYAQRVVVNGTPVAVTPECVQAGTKVTCSVPVTLLAGDNTVSVIASKNGVEKELRFTGINPGNGPKEPGAPRVNIVITIAVGGQ